MTDTGVPAQQSGRRFFLRYLRQYCFIFAVMMVLSVSVHPALAFGAENERIAMAYTTLDELNRLKATAATGDCPACKAGLANTSLSGLNAATITIRQIPLDADKGDATISGAETHSAGNVTISVRKEDWDESRQNVPAFLEQDPAHASGTAAADLMFADGAMGAAGAAPPVFFNSSDEERLADFANDSEVRNFTAMVNAWGFTTLTDARVERYEFGYKIPNASAEAANLTSEPVVADIARYTFSNASAYRYKFMAIQAYSANGAQIPPKQVVPGGIYPPQKSGKEFWGECWWTVLILILAVVALVVAILVALALKILEWYDMSSALYRSVYGNSKGSFSTPEDIADDIIRMPESIDQIPEDFEVDPPGRMSEVAEEFNELGKPFPQPSEYKEDILHAYDNPYWDAGKAHGLDSEGSHPSEYRIWCQENYDSLHSVMGDRSWNNPDAPNVNVLPQPATAVQMAQIIAAVALALNIIGWIVMICEYIVGFAGGMMIKTAMIGVILAVVLLLACAGWVTSQDEKSRMQEALNPENWIALSEQNNGGTVYIPNGRPSTFVLRLNETLEDGIPYSWHVTSGHVMSLRIYHPYDLTWSRIWFLTTDPAITPTTFSAEYSRGDDLAGPAKKVFNVTFSPVIFSGTDAIGTRENFGTSLAADPATDRMHVSYIEYDTRGDPWVRTHGRLMYRTGMGSVWEPPLVVDDDVGYFFTPRSPTTHPYTDDSLHENGHPLEMAAMTSIALDPEGRPHISYRNSNLGHLQYAHPITAENAWHSSDKGVRVRNGWMIETLDPSDSQASWGSSIAIGSDGLPHIAYLKQTAPGTIMDLKYAHWNDKAWDFRTVYPTSPGVRALATSATSELLDAGLSPSIALDSRNQPHISFPYPLVISCADEDFYEERKQTDYNQWHLCHILEQRMRSDNYDSPELLPLSTLKYASYDGTSWTIMDTDLTTWETISPYARGPTRHGRYSSLAIDSQDRPHISYLSVWDEMTLPMAWLNCDTTWKTNWMCNIRIPDFHFRIGVLKYARLDTPGPGQDARWTVRAIDTTSKSVGAYSSLKVSSDDLVHIAYFDRYHKLFRYALGNRHETENSTTWSRFVPPGQGAEAGAFSAMALDARGNPRSVYMDGDNRIKYVYASIIRKGNNTRDPAETPGPEKPPVLPDTPVPGPTPAVSPVPSPAPGRDPGESIGIGPLVPPGQSGLPDVPPPRTDTSDTGSAIAPAVPAGSPLTYTFGTMASASGPASIHTISLSPDVGIPASMAYTRPEAPLTDFRLQNRPAVYQNIGIAWANPSAIHEATIGFSVSKAWLDENHIEPANVVMMHQHDLAWSEIPTTFVRQEGDRFYYTAITPGFSYFAITDRTATGSAGPGVTVTGIPAENRREPAPAAGMTAPVTVKPWSPHPAPTKESLAAKTGQVPDPVPLSGMAATEESPLFFWLAIAALVSMIGVAGFFIGRRLWWQYQNPALFRRYD